jgi:hypothetical protein
VLEPRRSTLSVTDEEVADVAVDLVARMLGDVRELRRSQRPGRRSAPAASTRLVALGDRLRRLARRPG